MGWPKKCTRLKWLCFQFFRDCHAFGIDPKKANDKFRGDLCNVHLNTRQAKVCVQIPAVPVYNIDNSVILRLPFFQLVDPRSEIFLNLHPLRQPKRQLVVLELEGLQVQLVLKLHNREYADHDNDTHRHKTE